MASLKYIADSSLQTVTLGASYTAGSGSMTLTAGHGARLPSSGDFWMVYNDGAGTIRIFKVTARSTDTLTVTADATEGSGDGNISSGETLRWGLTVAALTQLRSDIVSQVASGMTLLETQTASASAALTFTSTISSTYDTYEFVLINLVPATNAQALRMEISNDGGSTWLSSNYIWRQIRYFSTSAGYSGSTTDSSFQIGFSQSNATLYNSGKMVVLAPATAFNYHWHGQGFDTSVYIGINGSGSHATTGINAVRFKFALGNITSGTIRSYGIAK